MDAGTLRDKGIVLGGYVCFAAPEQLSGPVLAAIARRAGAAVTEAELRQWDAAPLADRLGRWDSVEAERLAPAQERQRASSIRIRFADATPPATLAALAAWLVEDVPFLWAGFGYCLPPRSTWGFVLQDQAVQALVRRFWGVQVIDPVLLQWDALQGMPGVNWLNLVGTEFAQAKGVTLASLAAGAEAARPAGVFRRQGPHGLVLAAGPAPVLGDINRDEKLSAYARVAKLLESLTLKSHSAFIGPFATSKLVAAWLNRFDDPSGWLDAAVEWSDAHSAGFDELEL